MLGYGTTTRLFGAWRFLAVSLALLAGLVALFVCGRPALGAGELPQGFSQSRVAGGLSNPTAMEFAPDGRLFVTEQGGKARIVKDGQLLAAPFLDRTDKVDSRGERGLLGVTFDPDFETNGYVYFYFTREAAGSTPAHNRIVRYTADGDRVVPNSGKIILYLNGLGGALNHNGGAIHFGNDGKLYVAVGDNANGANAQSLGNLFGKILRINKDGTIPTDNPYYGSAKDRDRAIWARGFRNPFSFAVQPGTGRIYVNDVGQQTWEEIDKLNKGANYGWPRYEGPENNPSFTDPVFAYRQDGALQTSGCAITGGTFYNPPAGATARFPAGYEGDYLFADFCSGWIRRLHPSTGKVDGFKAPSGGMPVDLKTSPNGDLYFLAREEGSVERIQYSN